MIHRMDPAGRPRSASRCPRGSCRCSRAPACCRATTRRWAFEIKWDGVRAIAYSEPGPAAILESRNLAMTITARYPELARLDRALGSAPRGARRRDRRLRRGGAPELRRAAAADARRLGRRSAERLARRRDPVTYVIFDLLWLDGHSLMARPYAERRTALARAALDGERWQTPEHIVGNGARGARGQPRARPRGRRRQAPRQSLRAGAAQRRVDQAEERRPPGVRDRRLAAGRGAPRRAASARCCWACTRTPARCATSAASAAALSERELAQLARAARRRSSAPTRRLPPIARRRRAARCSASRGCWPRSSFASGRADGLLRAPSFKGLARGPSRRREVMREAGRPRARRRQRARETSAARRRRWARAGALEPRTRSSIPAAGFTKRRGDRLLRGGRAGAAPPPARDAR